MEIILDILNKNKFTEINVFGKERIKNSRIYVNFYSKFKYLKIIFSSISNDILFYFKKMVLNIEEKFWSGNFGDNYIKRNSDKSLLKNNYSLFKKKY